MLKESLFALLLISSLSFATTSTLWDNVKHLGLVGGQYDFNATIGINGYVSPNVQSYLTVQAGHYITCYLNATGSSVCYGGTPDQGEQQPYTGGNAIGMSAGNIACYLLSNGNSTCYGKGWNTTDGPATGNSNQSYTGGNAIAVSQGHDLTCYLLSTHNINCYGRNYTNETKGYSGGDAIGVLAQIGSGCALLSNGNISCWGGGTWGTNISYGGQNAIQLAQGGITHTCALFSNGNGTCWGINISNTAVEWNTACTTTACVELNYTGGNAIAVSSGLKDTCWLLSNGNSSCWGRYHYSGDTFLPNYTGGDAIAVAVGGTHVCYLKKNGTTECFGGYGTGEQAPTKYNGTLRMPFANSTHTTALSACGSYGTAGTSYLLNQSINSTGTTCLTVTAANITIDCAGFSIRGTNTSSTYGVYTNQLNTTIQNCNILNFSNAIRAENTANGSITNTNTTTSTGINIVLSGATNFQINNCNFTSTGGSTTGIYLAGASNYNNITNTTATAYYCFSLASYSNFNRFNNVRGIATTWGFYSSGASNETVANSTFTTTSSNSPIQLTNSNGSLFINNTLSSPSASNLLSIAATASNNIFYWNNFTDSASDSGTSHYYVNDLNGSNFYNMTEGNIYGEVMSGSVMVKGSAASSGFPPLFIGKAGAGSTYPYNFTNSPSKFSCVFAGCGDYAPLTPFSSELTANLTVLAINGTATPNTTGIFVPANVSIYSLPLNSSYNFTSWSAQGNCTINLQKPDTTVEVRNNCNVTASYFWNPPAVMTLAYNSPPTPANNSVIEGVSFTMNVSSDLSLAKCNATITPAVATMTQMNLPVVTGHYTTCYLLNTGNSECWGGVGQGEAANYNGGDAIAMGAGNLVCYIRSNGNSVCNGLGYTDGYGAGDSKTSYSGGNAVAVSNGHDLTCYLLNNGNTVCYGRNDYGQAHNYTGGDAIGVVAEVHSSCILRSNGNTLCWGNNTWGQNINYTGGDAVQIAGGLSHTCLLFSNGKVSCWGIDVVNSENWANTTLKTIYNYTEQNVLGVSAGLQNTCMLLNNGNVTCVGKYHYNYVKAGSYGGNDAVGVASGGDQICFLKSDGSTLCEGNNMNGEVHSYSGGNLKMNGTGASLTYPMTTATTTAEYTFASLSNSPTSPTGGEYNYYATCSAANGVSSSRTGTQWITLVPNPLPTPTANLTVLAINGTALGNITNANVPDTYNITSLPWDTTYNFTEWIADGNCSIDVQQPNTSVTMNDTCVVTALYYKNLSAPVPYFKMCYQESAYAANQSGTDNCGGMDYTGSGNCAGFGNGCLPPETYDGNWSTNGGGANKGINVIYKKPLNASSALWQVKDEIGTRNYSIDSSCFNAYDTELHVSFYKGLGTGIYWRCNDIDLGTSPYNSNTAYEEGVWWNITTGIAPPPPEPNITNSSYTFSYSNPEVDGLPDLISVNITNVSSSDNITANATYNNVTQTVTKQNSSNWVYFSFTAIPSAVNSTAIFTWVISVNGTVANYSFNTSVIYTNLTDCSTGKPVLNFTFFSQDALTTPVASTMSATFYVYSGNTQRNFSFNFSTPATSIPICLSMNNTNITLDSIQTFTAAGNQVLYYYLLNQTVNTNSMLTIPLYNLNSTGSVATEYLVYSGASQPVQNAYIQIQRYYPATGQLILVSMGKTNNQGIATSYAVANNVIYRYVIIQNYQIIYTSGTTTLPCDPSLTLCQTTIFASSVQPNEYSQFIGNVGVGCASNPASVYCTSNNPSGTSNQLTLHLYQIGDYSNPEVCTNTISSGSGTVVCALAKASDSYYYVGTVNITGNLHIIGSGTINVTPATVMDSVIGLFGALFLTVGLALFASKYGFAAAIIGVFLGVVLSSLMLFIAIPVSALVGLGIIAIVLGWIIRG